VVTAAFAFLIVEIDMDWILRRARLQDDTDLVDIALADGRIAAVGVELPGAAAQEWDIEGRVVLPGLVDAHTHLDKTYITIQNRSGTLLEAIEIWRQVKKTRTPAQIQAAARRALLAAIANGVTAMRSHVDIEEEDDLAAVAALLDLRQEMRTHIDLQLVALGWPGLSRESDALLAAALAMGVDAVGSAPALLPEPRSCIDAAFALAERTGKPIDLHIDECEDPNMLSLEHLAEQTAAHGMQGRVTAGHCCALGFAEEARAQAVMDKVAAAHVQIITLPSCNLVLMGRGMRPAPRGVTPVKDLLARGVNVSAASDNVHDPFNPFGGYDLLQIANLNAHVAHMSGEAELYASLRMVTANPARALGLDSRGIVPGAQADLVVTDARSVLDTVICPPARLATFKAGRLLVRSTVERAWHAPELARSAHLGWT
jgi:cytosine deaminase